MDPQFLVINNGMTELRGHYFENALSVAEAARERGFRVGLAAFADCDLTVPGIEVPDWLTVYPLFRLNHWGNRVAMMPPCSLGEPDRFALGRPTPFDPVLFGKMSMEEYISSQVNPVPAVPVPSPSSTISLRQVVKQFANAVLPPVVSRTLRWVYRRRPLAIPAFRKLTPPNLATRLRRSRNRHQVPECELVPSAPQRPGPRSLPDEESIDALLRGSLRNVGIEIEAELTRMFQLDLVRLLDLAKVRPGDHVYLPTAHGREALAVCRLVHQLGEMAPTFHLEFRHSVARPSEIEAGIEEKFLRDYTLVQRSFFESVREYPASRAIRFYADTRELADDYTVLSGLPFDVLPIPFRVGLFPQVVERPGGPLTVLFLGDARREKGFHHIPDLVRSLRDLVTTGRVRFVVQATLHPDETDPEVRAAMDQLAAFPEREVSLVGRSGFLAGQEYYRHLAEADVVVCPYEVESYRARSSGVFAEAVLAGKPTVVPSGTWMAGQSVPGGIVYDSPGELAVAVRKVCEQYPDYLAAAREVQPKWATFHNPARLVSTLVGDVPASVSRAA